MKYMRTLVITKDPGNLKEELVPFVKHPFLFYKISDNPAEFNLKNGDTASFGKIKDIDFSNDKKRYEYSKHCWEVNVENAPLFPGESRSKIAYSKVPPEELIAKYGTKENYADIYSRFPVKVFIYDGKWHSVTLPKGEAELKKEEMREAKELFDKIITDPDFQDYYMVAAEFHTQKFKPTYYRKDDY